MRSPGRSLRGEAAGGPAAALGGAGDGHRGQAGSAAVEPAAALERRDPELAARYRDEVDA
ncbi:hypothetical protein ABT168_17655 [Streptomyces sp. NPDC001793]|uniref:hypothetical protein n=1 Tax=Streptomyces sp. NPDC001793 TaxID=3154657 RepID=UPI00332F7ACD